MQLDEGQCFICEQYLDLLSNFEKEKHLQLCQQTEYLENRSNAMLNTVKKASNVIYGNLKSQCLEKREEMNVNCVEVNRKPTCVVGSNDVGTTAGKVAKAPKSRATIKKSNRAKLDTEFSKCSSVEQASFIRELVAKYALQDNGTCSPKVDGCDVSGILDPVAVSLLQKTDDSELGSLRMELGEVIAKEADLRLREKRLRNSIKKLQRRMLEPNDTGDTAERYAKSVGTATLGDYLFQSSRFKILQRPLLFIDRPAINSQQPLWDMSRQAATSFETAVLLRRLDEQRDAVLHELFDFSEVVVANDVPQSPYVAAVHTPQRPGSFLSQLVAAIDHPDQERDLAEEAMDCRDAAAAVPSWLGWLAATLASADGCAAEVRNASSGPGVPVDLQVWRAELLDILDRDLTASREFSTPTASQRKSVCNCICVHLGRLLHAQGNIASMLSCEEGAILSELASVCATLVQRLCSQLMSEGDVESDIVCAGRSSLVASQQHSGDRPDEDWSNRRSSDPNLTVSVSDKSVLGGESAPRSTDSGPLLLTPNDCPAPVLSTSQFDRSEDYGEAVLHWDSPDPVCDGGSFAQMCNLYRCAFPGNYDGNDNSAVEADTTLNCLDGLASFQSHDLPRDGDLEVSFQLSGESVDPTLRKVLLQEEMPRWVDFSMDQLVDIGRHCGLKRQTSREKMTSVLASMWARMGGSRQTLGTPLQTAAQATAPKASPVEAVLEMNVQDHGDIYDDAALVVVLPQQHTAQQSFPLDSSESPSDAVLRFLREDCALLEQLLSFEPLSVDELHSLLQSVMQTRVLGKAQLLKLLDAHGIFVALGPSNDQHVQVNRGKKRKRR